MTKKKTTGELPEMPAEFTEALDRAAHAPSKSPPLVSHVNMLPSRLATIADEIKDIQHQRAAAGGGCPSNWQNAMRYIGQAVESLETQAKLDAEQPG